MSNTVRFAGAQIPVTQNLEKNEASIIKAIDWAAENNCDWLLTPEGSLSGYFPNFDLVLENGGDVLVAYTVWSYKPRAGRDLVFELRDYAINNKEINRLVTLSPKTKMARRFHLNNGAVLLSENQRTDNYEYELDGEK